MTRNKQRVYYRDYSGFCREEYLADITQINWPEICSASIDLNAMTYVRVSNIREVDIKHAPLKIATNWEMR